MKKKLKQNLVVITSFFLLTASYAAETPTKMAVGFYDPIDSSRFPLLVTSDNQGAVWSFSPDISSRSILPSDFIRHIFSKSTSSNTLVTISCQNNFCVTAGRYNNGTGNVPLIGLSKDQGVSWHYTSVKPKDYANSIDIKVDPIKTTCNSFLCLITMPYINTQGNWAYFAIKTQDKGNSWSDLHFVPKLPTKNAIISAIICTEEQCLGVGYDKTNNSNGFVMISHDQATTWTFPKLNIPAKYQQFAFEDVKCKTNICIAKGIGYTQDKNSYLLLLRSVNGGDTWDVITTDYAISVNNEIKNGAITVTNNTWAIAGTSYLKTEKVPELHPFVLVSQDDGKSWTQPTDIQSKLPAELARTNHTQAHLISCSANDCVLSTTTLIDSTQIPALAISHNKGLNWTYLNISPTDLGAAGAFVNRLLCEGKNCNLMGYYFNSREVLKPFLLTTHNGGKTWCTPALVEIPGYVQAAFFGSAD